MGVIERDEALRLAEEASLDLVEIKPDVRPPICKIMDYGKYKYDQSKKKTAKNKQNKANEIKEVRLGRSVKIDKHDLELRVKQAREFLLDGHKVQMVQRFRGREMAHPEIGQERLAKIAEGLSDVAKLTRPPVMAGRQMSMMLEPDSTKIAAYKKEQAKAEKPDEAPQAETPAAESPPPEASASA